MNFGSPPSYLESGSGYIPIDEKTIAQSEQTVRMAFVRKVYSILAAQLLLTALICTVMTVVEPIRLFIFDNSWVTIVATVLSFISLIPLFMYQRVVPWNFLSLSVFTFFISIILGSAVAVSDGYDVAKSAFITFGMFLSLTLFTFQSKWDFSGLAPFLFGGLTLFLLMSIVSMFFPYSNAVQFVLGIGGCVIFSGYIVYDTYQVFEKMTPEDYIVAAVQLYLDILNLFLSILRMMGSTSGDDE
jgi:protein lifeguard